MAYDKVVRVDGLRRTKYDTVEQVEKALEPVVANPDIEELYFVGGSLSAQSTPVFAKVLETKKKLRKLDFTDSVGTRSKEDVPGMLAAIFKAALTLPKLQTLICVQNATGWETKDEIIHFIRNAVTIEHLDLSDNGISSDTFVGESKAEAEAKAAERPDRKKPEYTPEAAVQAQVGHYHALLELAEKKKASNAPPLRSLLYNNNNLNDRGAEYIGRLLPLFPELTRFEMQANKLHVIGLKEVVEVGLRDNRVMEIFNVNDCLMTEQTGRALIKLIKQWPNLRVLKVGDNAIKSQTSRVILKLLKNGLAPKLQVLELGHSAISEKRLDLLHDIVQQRPNLYRLALSGNGFEIDAPGAERLREILHQRQEKFSGGNEKDEYNNLYGIESEFTDSDEYSDETDDDDESDVVEQAEQAEQTDVPEDPSKAVDDLADALKKTSI